MINFGDKGLIVQYIQNFLKDNYNRNINLSDEYDRDTHKALIDYLMLPEQLDCYSMKDLIIKEFTFREIAPPNKLINGGGIWNFDFDITPNMIKFYNRPISECLNGALTFITEYIDKLSDFCREHGWYISYYTNFVYDSSKKSNETAEIIIYQESRKQLLPCKDIINMINLCTNEHLLNKCFLDNNNAYHGFIQDSNDFKISYIKAKPGDTFTITHGYNYSCELAIAYSENTLSEIKENPTEVQHIVSHLHKSQYGELNPGDYEIYTIPEDSDCKYLLVQMPFKNSLLSNALEKIIVKLGDINQDGKVNEDDRNILNQYLTNKSFTLSGPNLVAANLNRDLDINGKHIIDEKDLKILNQGKDDYGEAIYEKKIDLSESDYDKLLIMYGNIELNNPNNELNIPITEFTNTPWAIHDEFLPYILGSAIHKYSNINDILWLQNQVKQMHPDYSGLRFGYYDSPNDFIINEEFKWNDSKSLYEYYKNGIYTGYILDNRDDMLNANLRKESNLEISPVKIINGRWLFNGEWTGAIVLPNGQITKEIAKNSLKEIIKDFQLSSNRFYKNQNSQLIKFINGYVTPLTEKWITLETYNESNKI